MSLLEPFRGGTAEFKRLPQPPPDALNNFSNPESVTIITEHGEIFPNAWDWRPGDVLLFKGGEPTRFRDIIVSYQRRVGFTNEYAVWTHVALYVGNGMVADAIFDQPLQKRPLANLLQEPRIVAVRRFPDSDRITEDAVRVAVNFYLAQDYGNLTTYISLANQWLRKQSRISEDETGELPIEETSVGPVICSQFAFRVLYYVRDRRAPFMPNGPVPVPADFAAAHMFVPVKTVWHRLRNSA